MPTFVNLSGTGKSNIEVPYNNTMVYPLTFKDSDDEPIDISGNEFVFKCYKSSPAAVLFTVTGVISDDNFTVTFTHDMTLTVGIYRFTVDRINSGETMTRVRGQLKISK